MAFSPVYVSHMYEPAALRDSDSRACSRSHSHCRKPPFSGGLAVSPRPDDPPAEADLCGKWLRPGACCFERPPPKQGTFGPPGRSNGHGLRHPLHPRLLRKAHLAFRGSWPRAPPRARALQPGEKTGPRLYRPRTSHTHTATAGITFIHTRSETWEKLFLFVCARGRPSPGRAKGLVFLCQT